MGPLIECAELASRLAEVKLFDIRWSLTDPGKGRSTYQAGHIPDAVFVDLDTDLSARPGPGRHPLPTAETFAVTLGRLGLTPSDEVVVYDDVSGGVAARMWWMLHSIGHEWVRVVDGGYRVWIDQGRPIETGTNLPRPTTYPTPAGFTGVVSRHALGDRVLIDARASERYRGEVEPVDPKAGHIPGAINIPATSSLSEDGTFLAREILAEQYAEVGERPVVSCGSGVTACHSALALVVAGREMPDVYVGSFSEWSRLDLPVAVGDAP